MAQYNLSGNIDPNKVFLINRSELEGRFEVQYYLPEINLLEKTIRKKSSKKLRDFILKISSGATPSVQEEEKFYSDEVNGIPFLRVQNLNPNSKIDLLNLRYINKETHENYLRRSQVSEGDLLVKITGVGRMAIASVAPAGFIGNTNQHMAVIKTSDVEVSNYLANYINLNVIERLASRRATGATRPALDYTALKSIPIIENIDFSGINDAEEISRQKESEAKALLESIDCYLLEELGITLPERTIIKTKDIPTWMNPENLLVRNGRLFLTKMSEVGNGRFDPINVLNIGRKSRSTVYENTNLKAIANIKKGQSITSSEIIQGNYPVIAGGQSSPYSHNSYNNEANVITVSASGAYSGFVWYHDYPIFASDCSVICSKDETKFSTKYIFEVLKLKQNEIYLLQQGAGQPHVYSSDLAKLWIPIVAKEAQEKIVKHIDSIRIQAQTLKIEAENVLDDAKKKIEKMILGE